MAESPSSFGESSLEGSDQLPDSYCEPCYEASNQVKPVAGHCKNCDENLCRECYTSHCGLKLFRSHKLVKKSPRPILQPTLKNVLNKKVRDYLPTVALIVVAIILSSILKNSFFTRIEKVSATCDIVMEQINKVTVQLETLKENIGNESLLIAMKHTQSQLQTLEDKLDKLDKDNTVKKLKAILKVKRPIHVKDITVTASSDKPFHLLGSLVLPNNLILITDWENKKLKLIDKNQDKIISQLQLSGNPMDITKVREDEVAVSINDSLHTIQFISISKNSMSKVRKFTVDGQCKGIDYNVRDNTLIVTFVEPPKIQILDMAGTVIKCLEHDSMGSDLFKRPYRVALTPDMNNMYVTDWYKNSVTLLSLNGDVKAVYKDRTDTPIRPTGIYVHTSGLVYVSGAWSHTVHELDPETCEFKVVLDKKDGITDPRSISYGEIEDKMYIGMWQSSILKMFHMSFDKRK